MAARPIEVQGVGTGTADRTWRPCTRCRAAASMARVECHRSPGGATCSNTPAASVSEGSSATGADASRPRQVTGAGVAYPPVMAGSRDAGGRIVARAVCDEVQHPRSLIRDQVRRHDADPQRALDAGRTRWSVPARRPHPAQRRPVEKSADPYWNAVDRAHDRDEDRRVRASSRPRRRLPGQPARARPSAGPRFTDRPARFAPGHSTGRAATRQAPSRPTPVSRRRSMRSSMPQPGAEFRTHALPSHRLSTLWLSDQARRPRVLHDLLSYGSRPLPVPASGKPRFRHRARASALPIHRPPEQPSIPSTRHTAARRRRTGRARKARHARERDHARPGAGHLPAPARKYTCRRRLHPHRPCPS